MFLLKQILPAVLLALGVAAGLQGFAWWLGTTRARQALTPVALGLGYFSGHLLITGWTPFPPTDTTNWLPYFGLVAAGLGMFWGAFANAASARVAILALLAVGVFRLLLQPKFRHGWTLGQGWVWVIGLGLGMALLGVLLSALIRRRTPMSIEFPVIMLTVGTGTSVALMLSGSFLLGQFGAVFAGAIFGALVFTLGERGGIEGVAPVCVIFAGTLLASGYFFADLPGASAVLLAAAPVLALIPRGRLSGWTSSVIRMFLVSLPVAVAVIFALRASPPLYY